MTTKKIPLYFDNTFESPYGSFGSRLGALLLDWLFLSPVIIIVAIVNSWNLSNYYYTSIFSQTIVLSYFIYLPVRYGATPGKRLLKMTILKIDGSAIGYKASALKIFPQFLLGAVFFVMQCHLISLANEATFNELSWTEQSKYLNSLFPYQLVITMLLGNGFNFTNLIVFLLNERKRSISDLVAGTVVVYDQFLDQIREDNQTQLPNESFL